MDQQQICYEDIKSMLKGIMIIQNWLERVAIRCLNTSISKNHYKSIKKFEQEVKSGFVSIDSFSKLIKRKEAKRVSNKRYYKRKKQNRKKNDVSEKDAGITSLIQSIF